MARVEEGGGAIRFEGRHGQEIDKERGLRVPALLPVNAFDVGGLINVLGGAWTYLAVASTPSTVTIRVILVLEFGLLEPLTLLRLELQVIDSRGEVIVRDPFDAAVPESSDLTPKGLFGRTVRFDVTEVGVWTLRLRSGDLLLAEYECEIRIQTANRPAGA